MSRVSIDPVVWLRLLDELDLSLRQKAFLYKSRLTLVVESVEIEVLSELHVLTLQGNSPLLIAGIQRLFQGLDSEPKFSVRSD